MRKITLSLLIALVLVVLIAPFVVGVVQKHSLTKQVAQINAGQNQDFNQFFGGIPLKIKILDYKRGWFTSKAKVEIYIDSSTPETADMKLVNPGLISEGKIYHGPLIVYKDEGRLKTHIAWQLSKEEVNFNDSLAQALSGFIQQKPLAKVTELQQLNRSWMINLKTDDIAITTPEPKTTIQLKAIEQQMHISADKKKFKLEFAWDGMVFSADDGELTISGEGEQPAVSASSNGKKTTFGFWVGDSQVNVANISFNLNGQEMANINGIQAKASNELEGKVLNGAMTFDLKKLTVSGVEYGPAHYVVSVQNIGAKALGELQAVIRDNAGKDPNDPQVEQALVQAFQTILPQIFAHGFRLQINPMYFQTPDGEISGMGSFTLPDLGKEKPTMADLPMMLVGADASLVLHAPKAIVERLLDLSLQQEAASSEATTKADLVSQREHMLEQLLDANWLTVDGQRYVFSIAYKNGGVFVNGVAFNPKMMEALDH